MIQFCNVRVQKSTPFRASDGIGTATKSHDSIPQHGSKERGSEVLEHGFTITDDFASCTKTTLDVGA
jgi:hypothetical protein